MIENGDVDFLEEQQKVNHSDDCIMENLSSLTGKQTETISPGVNLQKQKEEMPLKSETPSLENPNTHKKGVVEKKNNPDYVTKGIFSNGKWFNETTYTPLNDGSWEYTFHIKAPLDLYYGDAQYTVENVGFLYQNKNNGVSFLDNIDAILTQQIWVDTSRALRSLTQRLLDSRQPPLIDSDTMLSGDSLTLNFKIGYMSEGGPVYLKDKKGEILDGTITLKKTSISDRQ
jgi:hypothetical protein